MTHDPKNYRDPKVTTGTRSSGGAMRWVWIVVAIIVVLLLLSWIFGGFGADRTVTTVPAEQTAPAAGATTGATESTGSTTTGATGTTTGTAPAGDATAPATEAPAAGGTAEPTPPAD